MNNKEIISKEVEKHFNEIIIDFGIRIGRLVGFAETEEDYYYIISHKNGERNSHTKEGHSYLSAVSDLVYLKDTLSDFDYERLDRLMEINGAPKENEVILQGI